MIDLYSLHDDPQSLDGYDRRLDNVEYYHEAIMKCVRSLGRDFWRLLIPPEDAFGMLITNNNLFLRLYSKSIIRVTIDRQDVTHLDRQRTLKILTQEEQEYLNNHAARSKFEQALSEHLGIPVEKLHRNF